MHASGHELVPRAVSAAPAPVREQHQAMRATRNGEVTGEPQSLGTHDHLVVEA